MDDCGPIVKRECCAPVQIAPVAVQTTADKCKRLQTKAEGLLCLRL
jgi:hypothetical protein